MVFPLPRFLHIFLYCAVYAAIGSLLLASSNIAPAVQAQSTTAPTAPAAPARQAVYAAGDRIPGQYIVVLRDQVTQFNSSETPHAIMAAQQAAAARTRTLVAQLDGEILHTYTHALPGFAIRIAADAVATLAAAPDVALIEPDRVVHAAGVQTPATWGIDRIDQLNPPLNSAYTYAAAGTGVHAYILDSGIRAAHSEFTGRIGNGFGALQDGNGTNDCYGHGTHVAGTLGGTTYGVAKDITLHPVRVLDCTGSGTVSDVVAGIDWVTANHQSPAVANMSIETKAVFAVLDQAVQNSMDAGVTYVIAAGNANLDSCATSPARVNSALTVGASTQNDQRFAGTNYGPCIDLFAPGYQILSAWHTGNSATRLSNGTSMAAPHVAGAVALYLEQQPDATPAMVAAAIIDSAAAGKLNSLGTGSPNLLLQTSFLEIPPGDGNVDGAVDAGDLTTCIQEIFDGDGSRAEHATAGTFPGTQGCDANGDTLIDAADISCIVLLIFHESTTCDAGQAANRDVPAELAIAADRTAVTGGQVAVPVTFLPNDAAVTTVAFALQFDANYLTLDPADHDENGIPDAIVVNQPQSDMALQMVDMVDNRVNVLVTDLDATPITITSGSLLTVTFQVNTVAITEPVTTPITFAEVITPSLGSATGGPLAVTTVDGVLQIQPRTPLEIYLPLIRN